MINIVRGKNNLAMVEKFITPTIEVSIGFRQVLEKAVSAVRSYGDVACMTSTAPLASNTVCCRQRPFDAHSPR
ncbi:MAG: hypothetical protein GY880_16265 [Planctomycetaceae bacterium]|nr:hypothetical protein [Planctomycetaceae bacterium]